MADSDWTEKIAENDRRLAALELAPTDVQVQHKSFTANAGQHCIVEAPAAGLTVTLPHARPQNRNARIAFTLRNGNPVRFIAVDSKVNGRSSGVMAAPGTFDAISDGLAGWGISVLAAGPTALGPPLGADFVVGVANPGLPNARVATASVEITPSISVANVISWALNASSVALAKLQNLTGLSVLGRASNSIGVMAAITAGGAAQYLRSNAAGTSLEFGDPASASIINTGGTFQRAAATGDVTAAQNSNAYAFRAFGANAVLGNPTAGSAVPVDVTVNAQGVLGRTSGNIQSIDSSVQTALIRGSGSVFWASAGVSQYLGRNGAGDLGFGLIPLSSLGVQLPDTFVGNITAGTVAPVAVGFASIDSTSIVYDATTHTFQRAALTGAITAAQDSNTTAFGALSAKSVLANATNASAVPAALAGSAAFQHLRVNAANTGLEWSLLTSGDFPAGVIPLTALASIPTLNQVATAGNTTTLGLVAGAFGVPGSTSTAININAVSTTNNCLMASGGDIIIRANTSGSGTVNPQGVDFLFGTNNTPQMASLGLNFTNGLNPATPTPANNTGSLFCNGSSGNPRLLWRTNSTQDWPADCVAMAANSTITTVTAAITNLIVGTKVIFANALEVGSSFKFEGFIVAVNTAAPPSITLEVLIGATVVASQVMPQAAAAGTFGGMVRGYLMFTVIGASGKAIGNCHFAMDSGNNFANALNASGNVAVNAAAFNTTANLTITMQVRMTTAVASNSLTMAHGFVARIR